MTIDPNATLSELRRDLDGADDFDNYGPNATLALKSTRRLLAHLDAGGPLPDAWTPFYTPSADLAAALQTIEHAAANTKTAAELEAWAKVDLAAAERWAVQHATSEPDPRSIAGALHDALEQWSKHDETWAGDDLAAAAQALLDCQPDEHQPTHLEMAEQLRLTRRGNEQLVQRRQADMDTIDRLTHDLAATEQLVQRIGDQRNTYQQESYDLRDELTSTQSEADELRHRNETQRASVRNVLSSPNLGNAQHDAAYALVARAAAHIVQNADGYHTAEDYPTGTAAAIRHAADRIITGQHHDNTSRAHATIAAMLAVGASRYGSRRKDDDLANRTVDHLREIAETLTR